MNRVPPRTAVRYRDNSAGREQCWRLRQKYDRYVRTGAQIGACQIMGEPDRACLLFGDPAVRVGALGRNRACISCGRYWIS